MPLDNIKGNSTRVWTNNIKEEIVCEVVDYIQLDHKGSNAGLLWPKH
jgi:hypothetical protein